jgi:protein involved in polysaccharide export with SLBB domain
MPRFALLVLLIACVLQPHPLPAQDTALQGRETAETPITLLPGDLLRIQIWREADLSGEFQVDLDGIVILPLIGEKMVTGIPVRRLREVLIEDYQVHLRNPSINVTPLRRIHVLGEVQRPGILPVDPTVSLADAIALAGGTTAAGDLQRIRLMRGGQVLRERVGVAETLRSVDLRSGDQIYVERRPWLQRNPGQLLGTAISLANLTFTIIRIRRSQ